MSQINVNNFPTGISEASLAGAKCHVYVKQSDTLAALFSDPYLRNLTSNPLVADANGVFKLAYLLDGAYSVAFTDARGAPLMTAQNILATEPLTSPNVHHFTSVSALFGDMLLSYDATQTQHYAAPGDRVTASTEGLCYVIASATATDHDVETASGIKLYLADPNIVDIRAFNADPNADASAELQAAIDLWIKRLEDQIPCMLRIPCTYSFQTGLVFNFTKNIFVGGALDMRGGHLISDLQSPGTAITFSTVAGTRNLSFYDFHVVGSTNDTITVLIDGGSPSSSPQQFLYNWQLYSPKVENAPNLAMKWTGNFFECQMFGPWVMCTNHAPGTYACLMEDTNTANPSSMDIYGGSMRGGFHALFTDKVSDVKVFGGTFLNTGAECVSMVSNIAGGISGAHIENAYDGSPGTGQAGVLMTNAGFVRDLYGTSNNGNNDTLLEVYSAAQGIEVAGLRVSGGVTDALIVRSGSQKLKLYGVPRELIDFADIHAERATSFSDRGRIKRVPSATGSQTIDVAEQDWFDATLAGNVTIETPTNPVAGDELVITLQQSATGGNTVTWSAFFVVKTQIDPTASKRTTWTFRYTGGAWLEVSALAGI